MYTCTYVCMHCMYCMYNRYVCVYCMNCVPVETCIHDSYSARLLCSFCFGAAESLILSWLQRASEGFRLENWHNLHVLLVVWFFLKQCTYVSFLLTLCCFKYQHVNIFTVFSHGWYHFFTKHCTDLFMLNLYKFLSWPLLCRWDRRLQESRSHCAWMFHHCHRVAQEKEDQPPKRTLF